MSASIEQQLRLRTELIEAVEAVDETFPTYQQLDEFVRPDNTALGALSRAADVLNAAAAAPLIAGTRVVGAYAQIASRIKSPEVSDPDLLCRQIGRMAIGKPVISTPTRVHPPKYDPLTYEFAARDDRVPKDRRFAGVLVAEPSLRFGVVTASHPRVHALTMGVSLQLAMSETDEDTVALLPAQAASLRIGQGDIRKYLRTLIEDIAHDQATGTRTGPEWVAHTSQLAELEHAVAAVQAITSLLHRLDRPSVGTSTAQAVIQTGNAEREARLQNVAPRAPQTNRRHAQNIRAGRVQGKK